MKPSHLSMIVGSNPESVTCLQLCRQRYPQPLLMDAIILKVEKIEEIIRKSLAVVTLHSCVAVVMIAIILFCTARSFYCDCYV